MIQLFCPSRGRPLAAGELLDSFLATKSMDDTHLTFCLDYDDPERENYPLGWTALDVPTGDPTGPLNLWALKSEADIVGFCGDDSRIETRGWDELVRVALKDPGFCWGFDGTSSKPWPSTIFVSREIVQALGYLALPTLHRGFFDVVWCYLAARTKTERIIPAMFRHDNSAGDPVSPNFKPEAQVPPEVIAADEQAYQAWLREGANDDVRKVRTVTELAHFFA